MLSQSSWVGNSRRYDAYSARSRRNVPYPQQPAYLRAPRRGRPVPGPIRNPISSYRNCTTVPLLSQTNNIKRTTGCPNNAKPNYINLSKNTKSICRKKSISMVDLSPVSINPDIADLRSESTASLQTRLRKVELSNCEVESTDPQEALGDCVNLAGQTGVDIFQPDTNKAASLVCRALVVNAWRRRREDNSQLQETIQQLNQQVDRLHIQIIVLRRLLDTENGRVGRFMSEMQRARVQYDDVVRDRDALKVEKEEATQEVKQLREEASVKIVATENLRNELFTVKSQLSALDGQISRDREKLLKLREEKRTLLEKVSANEALVREHLARTERAEAGVQDLESRLSVQLALLNTAWEQQRDFSQEAKFNSEEMMKVKEQLKATQKTGEFLSMKATNLENQLSDRDAALRQLESAYNSQL